MFDFPNAPVNGTTYTPPGGPSYIYQNGVWLQVASSASATDPYRFTSADMQMKSKAAGQVTVNNKADGTGTDIAAFNTTGDFTVTGSVWSNGNFLSVSGPAILGSGTTGTIYLRPNGPTNGTGQVALGTDGRLNTGPITCAAITMSGGTSSNILAFTSTSAINITGIAGTNPYLQQYCSGNPNWASIVNQYLHYPGVWAGHRTNVNGDVFDFRNGGSAYKPGGGAWADVSDIRIKNIIGPYKSGLAEVVQLNPVWYTFRGNDTDSEPLAYMLGEQLDDDDPRLKMAPAVPYPNSTHYRAAEEQRQFVGVIAQDAEKPMPEMVTKRTAYIDGIKIEDFRDLDTSALIYALVNAVKELAAKVAALEGGK